MAMKTVDSMIADRDKVKSLGRPGVMVRPTVYPFFYQITIADTNISSQNFPEMQNTELVEFHLESDGALTIQSNLYQLLTSAERMVLNGSFDLVVPPGYRYPLDFVPELEWENTSGGNRYLAFFGWLTAKGVY